MEITKTKKQIIKERNKANREYRNKFILEKVKQGIYKNDRHSEEGKKRQLQHINDWIYRDNALLCIKRLFGTCHLI